MKYDVFIIGGGPGGYVAAIKAAQLGAKVALAEEHKIGGICLNYGCIPTKTMLRTAKLYKDLLQAESFGIDLDAKDAKINWDNLMKRKDKVVNQLVGGVKQLLKHNGVTVYPHTATALSATKVEVDGETHETKSLIVATGSETKYPPIKGLEEGVKAGKVIDSTGAIKLDKLPEKMVILGGGVIAIEFATLFHSLGVEVSLLQRSEKILSFLDDDVSDAMQRHLKKEGVKIITNAAIKEIKGSEVIYEHDGEEKSAKGDYVLASLGRAPRLTGLEKLNLKTDKHGVITNEYMETNVKGVYAIGDINGKYMLAHVASAEGIIAAQAIMGKMDTINYNKVPSCIYSFPEVGVVGLTESQAKEKGFDVATSKFPLSANGKALAEGESMGFVKIVSDKTYGEVLGVHIIASHATDMIAEAAASMELEATVHDLARTIHPHPTLSEIVMEAAHGAVDQPIHMAKKS